MAKKKITKKAPGRVLPAPVPTPVAVAPPRPPVPRTYLDRVLDFIGEHRKKVAFGVLSAGVIALGSYGFANKGDLVYKGRIDVEGRAYNVSYLEDSFDANVLTAERKGIKFQFEDKKNRTGIKWMAEDAPEFSIDELEGIVSYDGRSKNSRKYGISDVNEDNIKGMQAKEQFSEGNELYNKIRGVIREKLRQDYKKDSEDIQRFYKQDYKKNKDSIIKRCFDFFLMNSR